MSQALHFVPRNRRPMEALDLGLGLLQAHWGPIYRVFLMQVGIILAMVLPFTWSRPAWVLLWMLWLTPFLNRGTLYVLSRRVFGQEAGALSFLSSLKDVCRRGLVASLLWRRLSPARSFLLPVWQLEDQGGVAYAHRTRILFRQSGGTAFLLGILCLLFGGLTLFGILGLMQMMLPRGIPMNLWDSLGAGFEKPWFSWLFTLFGLLAFAVMEPFYAAAGFALYLNRRTQLEGWDLEQSFRALAARLASASRQVGRAVLLAFLLAPGLAGQEPTEVPVPDPPADVEVVATEEPAQEPPDSEVLEEAVVQEEPPTPLRLEDPARKALEQILAEDPDLRRTRTDRVLRYRPTGQEFPWLRRLLDALFGEAKKKENESKPNTPFDAPWLKYVALILKILLVACLVALVLYLVIRFHASRLGRLRGVQDFEAPEAVAGLDIRPESLPTDVPGEALARFRHGDPRGALALLYRGALAALVHRHRLPIPASATEGDCLRASLPVLDESPALRFRQLTSAWVRMAYRGEAPVESDMAALCSGWREAFGERA